MCQTIQLRWPAPSVEAFNLSSRPERDATETTALLLPMATDPGLEDKLNASTDDQPANEMDRSDDLAGLEDTKAIGEENVPDNPASLARTIGVILGSPAFQRR